MRYLVRSTLYGGKVRKYNEDNSAGLTELEIRDFCEINLAYLIDDGMEVDIDWDPYYGSHENPTLMVYLYLNEINKPWNEIKDQIIPFFIRLIKQYNLVLLYSDEDWTVGFYLEEKGPLGTEWCDYYFYDINEIIDEGVGYDNEYNGTNDYNDILDKEEVIVDHIKFCVKSKK